MISGEEGVKHYQDKFSKNDSTVLVSIVNNEVVDYLCGSLAKAGSCGRLPTVAVTEIETFFALDEFRTKGIGKTLR